MPDLNPMVAGDVPYPQYSVTITRPISDTLVILKGVVYTSDAAGRLVVVSTTLQNGIFQSKATPLLAAVVANDDAFQVLTPRTRMIFDDAVGGLVPGEDVLVVANTTNIVTGLKSSILYIGKVFEIYTRNTDSTRKLVSVSGDKIIVETVQA